MAFGKQIVRQMTKKQKMDQKEPVIQTSISLSSLVSVNKVDKN
jgi:hypothetical protein